MAMYYTPIPHEFLEEMGELSDAEYGRLIRWCQTYNMTGEETELSGNERFFRRRCKNQIDKIRDSYEAMCEKNRRNGAKGGRPKTKNNPEEPSKTQNNPTVFSETQNNPEEPKKPNKNININKNIKEKDTDSKESVSKKKAVITAWNEAVAGSMIPELRVLNGDSTRYRMLNARIKEYGLDEVIKAIGNVSCSDFLRNSSWFSFDWFVKPNNFIKVYEGNYRNEEKREKPAETNDAKSWIEIAEAMGEHYGR